LRRDTLRRSNDLQSALLHSISHDLHSPLASINDSAILMAESDALDERQEYLRQLQAKNRSVLALVDNLLDMLRLEAGALEPRREWQYVEEVIDTAIQRFDNITNGRELRIVPYPELPPLFIDGVLILQVLTNLIDNAIKFSFPDSVIEIDARVVGRAVEITVTNDGDEIPPGQHEDLFRPFHRGPRSGPQGGRTSGSGLGLAICKGIVAAHEGSIGFRPGPRGKTSICFSLPVLEQNHAILESLRFSSPAEQT